MTSLARSRQSKLAQLPAHPAFPLVMALWIAVFVGLGGLVLMLLRMPQLGPAALSAAALLGALAGAIAGLLLGRKVYRSNHAAFDEADPPSQRRRSPINAHEELGEGGFDVCVEEAEPDQAPAQEGPAKQSSPHVEGDEPPATGDAQDITTSTPEPASANTENALDALSLMQLAQRLQGAVVERRTMRAVPSAATSAVTSASEVKETPESTSDEISASPPEIEAQANSAEDDGPSASAVHHPAHKPFVETDELMAGDTGEDEAEEHIALGETYTSLLAMTASVRAQPEQAPEELAPASDSRPVRIAPDPARTLASLDRASQPRREAAASVRKLDPQDQTLRDALMNLQQFTQHS